MRHIGTSNMTVPKLTLLLRDAGFRPACNEMEMHPHFQQPELFPFLLAKASSRLRTHRSARPNRPDRGPHARGHVAIGRPGDCRALPSAGGWHPAAVCIRWSVQHAGKPIPFSTSASRELYGRISGGRSPTPLTRRRRCRAIARLDSNCRLIKGHVFLWKDEQSWEDLWDIKGEITPL